LNPSTLAINQVIKKIFVFIVRRITNHATINHPHRAIKAAHAQQFRMVGCSALVG
jgi:hypothetical protein